MQVDEPEAEKELICAFAKALLNKINDSKNSFDSDELKALNNALLFTIYVKE